MKLPQLVPPAWSKVFGYPVVPQYDRVLTSDEASVVLRPISASQVFEFTYRLSANAFPASQPGVLVFVLGYQPFNVSYAGRVVQASAVINVTVVRPDGEAVTIAQGHSLNVTIDAGLVASQLASLWQQDYHVNVTAGQLMQNPVQALFGKPVVRDGRVVIEPLRGEYRFIVRLDYYAPGVPPRVVYLRLLAGAGGASAVELVVSGNAYGLSGTDNVGHDLALGLLYGFPVALLVGIFTAAAAVVIGLVAGIVSGYYGGWVDEAIQRLIDIMANIPVLPILVLVGYVIQTLYQNPWARLFIILGVLVLFSWGGMAIVIRSMTLSIRAEPYIETARAIGASNARIIFRYILPQVLPYAFASMVFNVPAAILTEAGLEILGIHIGLPGWGSILSSAEAHRDIALAAWWWVFPPGILLAVTSLAFVLLGIALETIVEPRLRAGR